MDECHRTQSGELHKAMKAMLPNAVFIGFTGTPLLKADKQTSIEVFGRYIHTYKFDEAVQDDVVLDLRYEARDIDQSLTSQTKIDQWFEAKTKGLTDWRRRSSSSAGARCRRCLSSQSRLEKIVADILLDMEIARPAEERARQRHAGLRQHLRGVQVLRAVRQDRPRRASARSSPPTSPSPADIKGEETGEGLTEQLRQYDIYRKMLADWFNEPPETAVNKVEAFEKAVKKKFIDEPGQMKLLIVVDKLLTGFDAPPATYLYIDKQMRDHGLFQAICRVNRLDGDDKEYGYIVDYKDLFKSLEGAVNDYTSRRARRLRQGRRGRAAGGPAWQKARERLEEAREAVKALCEPVEPPQRHRGLPPLLLRRGVTATPTQLKDNEPKRLALYKLTSRRSCAPTPTSPTRWPRPATRDAEIAGDQGRSRRTTRRCATR